VAGGRRFRGEADPKTWLYRLCITQARRARSRHRVFNALTNVLALLPREALVSTPSFSEHAAQRRIDWNTRMDQLIREGRPEELRDAATALEGKQLVDRLLAEVEAFRDNEEALDERRLKNLEQQAFKQTRLLVLGMTTLYPRVRFRAALGRGLMGSMFYAQGMQMPLLAAVVGSAASSVMVLMEVMPFTLGSRAWSPLHDS